MAMPERQGYGSRMDTTALEVRLRESTEHVELARLTSALNQVREALVDIDRVYLMSGSRPKWVVVGLRQRSSDLVVRVAPRETPKRDQQSLVAPIDALVSGVRRLQEVPEMPQYYTEATVQRLLKFGNPGKGLQELSLATVNGQVGPHVVVSEPVRQHAREAVTGSQTSLGSVAGWLDIMNARNLGRGRMKVGIFDRQTHRAVSGDVPADMEEQAKGYWLKRVLARGRVTRNERGQAVRIQINHLELLPQDDSGRAAVSDLLGADPGWLGGQAVDDYLREARRA